MVNDCKQTKKPAKSKTKAPAKASASSKAPKNVSKNAKLSAAPKGGKTATKRTLSPLRIKLRPPQSPHEDADVASIHSEVTPPPELPEGKLKVIKEAVGALLGKRMAGATDMESITELLDAHAESHFADGVEGTDEEDGEKDKALDESQVEEDETEDKEGQIDKLDKSNKASEDEERKHFIFLFPLWKFDLPWLSENVQDVKFLVPVGGADEVATVASDITWTEFLNSLANVMGVAPKNVSVAYCFSTDPRHA